MASTPTLTHTSLKDYTALPQIREFCKSKTPQFLLTSLPPLDVSSALEEAQRDPSGNLSLNKKSFFSSSPPVPTGIIVLASVCHKIAADVFNSVSHALELPWEKYLSEMHEFSAEGNDELRVAPQGKEIERAWSTLTFVIDSSNPSCCLVVFGEALAVFSEDTVGVEKGANINLPAGFGGEGSKILYYVRPNGGVYYTRVAGALMTPLSEKEHREMKRVKDIEVGG